MSHIYFVHKEDFELFKEVTKERKELLQKRNSLAEEFSNGETDSRGQREGIKGTFEGFQKAQKVIEKELETLLAKDDKIRYRTLFDVENKQYPPNDIENWVSMYRDRIWSMNDSSS
jgi:uncharacterized protein YoxC